MSSPVGIAVPGWLSRSQTFSHLTSALQTLTERETMREHARALSRQESKNPTTATRQSRFIPSIRNGRSDRIPPTVHDSYSVAVGYQPENQHRNRYLHLEPYDRTRVIVGEGNLGLAMGDNGKAKEGRYLNANWVLERFGHKWWIAAQAPLPNTAHAFLSVILQPITRPPHSLTSFSSLQPSASQPSRVRTVVQLTQNVESGRRKAHAYFPDDVGRSMIVAPEEGCCAPPLKVTLLKSQVLEDAHCIQSTIYVAPVGSRSRPNRTDSPGDDRDEGVTFRHMLYTTWPDHGVPEPEDRESLLAFLRLVDRTNRDLSLVSHLGIAAELDPDPPVMVGCSAGIGRTGSFIALSSILRALDLLPPTSSPTPTSALPPSPLGPLPEEFEEDMVAQEVDSLREQRPGMVQRKEQVLLIYEVLMDALAPGTVQREEQSFLIYEVLMDALVGLGMGE